MNQQPYIVNLSATSATASPSTAKELVHAADLEKPSESIKFLEYFQAHAKKVERFRGQLVSWSKVLFVVGLAAFGYGAFQMLTTKEAHVYGKGKLGAGKDSSSDPMSVAFNSMSVMVWGLIAAKAKTGLNAAQDKDATSVSQAFSRVISMSLLIVLATCLNLYSKSSALDLDDALSFEAPVHHVLESASPKPASFYDHSSSHYLGGAHNAALEAFKKTPKSGFKP